jgi:formylmethanofuran dehydrogenase subunit B
MTGQKSVLAIGLDPKYADLAQIPHLTAELIQSYIDAQLDQLRALGYQVTCCLVDRGETAEQSIQSVLSGASFDCVVVGAGIRKPDSKLLLFEKVINLVHQLAPGASICFNTSPGDTVQAVRRWMPITPD